MKTIRFRENFNNKLNCKYFTTIRDLERDYIFVGATYNIYIGSLYVKKAVLLRADPLRLSQLDDLFCYMDAAIDKSEFLKVMQDFYPHFDLSDHIFYRLLFKTIY